MIKLVKLFKYFSFWFTLFAISICIYNLSGFDDKNLLLSITSPVLWLLEDYSSFLKRFISEQLLMCLFYFLSVFSWCCIGLLIDAIFHSSNRKKILLFLSRIGIASCVIILISVIFYTVQNSEKQISNILKNPDKYNEQSVRIAVVTSAKEGYGDKYIDEMATILQTTKNEKIYQSTIYALGLVGTPNSIEALVEHCKVPEDLSFALPMNEKTIMSMIKVNQPQNLVKAGIEAAKLLGFGTFVQPLSIIIKEYPNKEIKEMAAEVLVQISQNPKVNNPKYNFD